MNWKSNDPTQLFMNFNLTMILTLDIFGLLLRVEGVGIEESMNTDDKSNILLLTQINNGVIKNVMRGVLIVWFSIGIAILHLWIVKFRHIELRQFVYKKFA